MGFMDKFKDFIQPDIDEDEDEVEVEEIEETAKPVRQAKPAARQTKAVVQPQSSAYEKKSNGAADLDDNTKMVLFEPRSYGEAESIGASLKEGRAVVVNMHKLTPELARRTIDFLSGVVYALGGNVRRIGDKVFLCYPKSIGVAGNIDLSKPAQDTEEAAEE